MQRHVMTQQARQGTVTPTTTPAPPPVAAPTTDTHRLALLHDRVERLAVEVAKVQCMMYRVKARSMETVPLYDHIPSTLDTVKRFPVDTVEEDEVIILQYPQHEGTHGIIFMAVPKCDADTGEIRVLYAPVYIPDSTTQSDAMEALGLSRDVPFGYFSLV